MSINNFEVNPYEYNINMNGYSNYITYIVATYFDNHTHWNSIKIALLNKVNLDDDDKVWNLCNEIIEVFEVYNPVKNDGVYKHIMDNAVSEIDFYQIAENWITELEK